ncbi:MAG TPA: hypothetical protein PKM78_08370 [Anaerolineae bacterium]|nr:hypothetical protein [Anaerolineae bacterium]HNU03928.1 hypothetical protein [Anaerolineae bacterium]
MTARLSETYRPGDLVEVLFEIDGVAQWLPGQAAGSQPPGLWVRLSDGSMWFVTNTRRIRPAGAAGSESD